MLTADEDRKGQQLLAPAAIGRAGSIALAALLVLGAGTTARGAPCEPLPETVDLAADRAEVRLDLNEMASLPPQTVILAGAFRDAGSAVQPALLTSEDGGATWSTTPVRIRGAELGHLVSDRAGTVWATVSFTQEGVDEPLYLLRSQDAARTWCAIALDELETLNGVDLLRMYDGRHGLMVFSEAPFGSGFHAYQTGDGGETWALLWRAEGTPLDVADMAADYPDRPPPEPPHATLWRRETDLFAADALIRLRRDDGGYLIERYDLLSDREWSPVSRIDRMHWQLNGEEIPIP